MWNFKRVVILSAGLVFFGTLYLLYTYFLGGINGLPALPRHLLAGDNTGPIRSQNKVQEGDRKLIEAFGPESPELGRPIRLDLSSRRAAVSAGEFAIEPDGRVMLTPFSAALFPAHNDGKYEEINTVQCQYAFLTFDQPVANLSQISGRKVVGVELRGERGVTVINNRRTKVKNDDLEVLITGGPVLYDEKSNRIWTDGWVKLLDTQTQPRPTSITARGMEIRLAENTGPNGKPAATADAKKNGQNKKGENVNGVEMITLRSNVEMHLWVDAQDGFLGGPADGASKSPSVKKGPMDAVEKAQVVIKTNGPFKYDLVREFACFDSPPSSAVSLPLAPEQVTVLRVHKVGQSVKNDQLLCDHLELQFKRKPPGAAAGSKATGQEQGLGDREIQTALATVPSGKQVVLAIDSENLEAYGSELHYRAMTAAAGAQTILKGQPLHALRDCHKIEARELHMIGADKHGKGQQAFANGPGQIDLFDKSNANRPYPQHAFWKDTLIVTKDRDGDKEYDLLTLTGDAAFVDDEQKQELSAKRLQVWLQSTPASNDPKINKEQANALNRQKLVKVEAFERVAARSPDVIIRDSHHLVIRFKEDLALDDQLPAPNAPKDGPIGGVGLPVLGTPDPKGVAGPNEPAKVRKPIELTAKEIVVYVSTRGTKKQLQELVTEGNVHVTQENQNSKDKGLDIQGDMLNLLNHPEGDILYVFGNAQKPAQLEMGEVILIGPKVVINRRENMAEVEGTGAMQMPSNTTFEGGKPTKPGRITIYWTKDMDFNGKYAYFRGGVQAVQDNAKMLCENLEVVLDKSVSFKDGQKGGQAAKVEKLLCDRKVYILDEVLDPSGKVLSKKQLEVYQLQMDNQDGTMVGVGRGRLNILGMGDDNLALAPPPMVPPKGKGPANPKQIMKRTQIDFENRMWASTKENAKSAKFYDNVEVRHWICDNFKEEFPANKIPKDGLFMKCDRLEVLTKPGPEKKTYQNMVASGRVAFRTSEYDGLADTIKFDESQDVIILEANAGNTCILTKLPERDGGQPQIFRGRKILYNRRTGQVQADGIQAIGN